MPTIEQDEIFQSTIGSRPGYIQGRGYMAKSLKSKATEVLRAQVNAQAKENEILNEKVDELKSALDAEHTERDRVIAQRVEEAKQSMRD